ncbi:uncharacterized protein LOC133732836 [Rosa rugosa]|uniref:uncharacterized protein LOC133732836 n=1 Tax=Rosa rugosa TaxID=74645 RepID=UPI002B40A799|nr:uncharacterized protein LOC133732836 [Rosa rugosa]
MKREMAGSVKLSATIPALVMVMVMVMAIGSEARELRPSDHGLVYTPAGNTSAAPEEAKTFFSGGGGGGGGGESGGVALPKAMNSNDTSWWEGVNARGRGKDHVRDVLVVVSLVCGITGVVLFVASAFVYLLRYRKRKASSPPPC